MCQIAYAPAIGFYPASACSAWWPGDPRPWWHYASAWGGDELLARRRVIRDRDEEQSDLRDERLERAHAIHDEAVLEFREEP